MAAAFLDPYGGDEAAPLVEKRFLDFLQDFQIDPPVEESQLTDAQSQQQNIKEYVEAVYGMKDNEMTTMFVDFAHLRAYDDTLASTIAAEFYR